MQKVCFVALVTIIGCVCLCSGADNAFRDFQKNDQKDFKDWKTGKKPAASQPTGKAAGGKVLFSQDTSYSAYKTYLLPPVVKAPEDQKAWNLYKGYLDARKKIADTEKEIKRIESIGAETAVVSTWKWLASSEEKAKHDRLVAELPGMQKELAAVEDAWTGTYSGYYGPLSDSARPISVNYLDPNDKSWPQKMQTTEMDRIEFRLRSFPFSQRGSGGPVTADAPPPEEPQITKPGDDKPIDGAKPGDDAAGVTPPGDEGEQPEQEPGDDAGAETDPGLTSKKPPKGDDMTKPGTDEEEGTDTVAPSLIRTSWKGRVIVTAEEMLNENDEMESVSFDPPLKGDSKLEIDNSNKITGSFEIPDCARPLRMGDTDKPLKVSLTGSYDSKSGRLDVTAEGRLNLPNNGAHIANVPMANYIKVAGGMTGTAGSDSDISGKMTLTASHILEPSRQVTAEDIEAYIWKECPEEWKEFDTGENPPRTERIDVNAGARVALKEGTLKAIKEVAEQPMTDKATITGAWRMSR